MSSSSQLAQNYAKTIEDLDAACQNAGRKREDITLVAVSKFHSPEAIGVVADMGQLDFGENYVQEATHKQKLLEDLKTLRWHMIGHIQSRKASTVAGSFSLVHTLDSVKLADIMEKNLASRDLDQKVLIEVNIADEDQKSGVRVGDLFQLVEHVETSCPHLKLQGLMCLPPVFDSGEAARPYFAQLYNLREKINQMAGRSMPHLSMGMSGDFVAAIEEGATIVRIGTNIFGQRPARKVF